MHASAASGDFFRRRWGARRHVLCAACGFRFDAGSATSGDEARCPTCGVVVRVGALFVAKHRVQRSPPVAAAGVVGRRPLSKSESRRAFVRVVVLSAVAFGLAALWIWWDDVLRALRAAQHDPAVRDAVVKLR